MTGIVWLAAFYFRVPFSSSTTGDSNAEQVVLVGKGKQAGGQGDGGTLRNRHSFPEAEGQGRILRSPEILTFDSLLDVGCCPITKGHRLQPQALHGKLLLVHSDMKLASGQHQEPLAEVRDFLLGHKSKKMNSTTLWVNQLSPTAKILREGVTWGQPAKKKKDEFFKVVNYIGFYEKGSKYTLRILKVEHRREACQSNWS